MGKTSAVLKACQELSHSAKCPYFYILWMSARDVDLTVTGPVRVSQDTETLDDVLVPHHRTFAL